MQETRQQILEILKERGEATVDELVSDLGARRGLITAVTVRHHLAILQDDGLVDSPQMRHRSSPGRPQHIYALTEQGIAHFPNNYQTLAVNVIRQLQYNLPAQQVNVIIEGVADAMANDLSLVSYATMREKLDAVVEYLNTHGYDAGWRVDGGGYMLHTSNCPYHHIAQESDALCRMDMRLIARMLGVVPRMVSRVAEGAETCSYFIPEKH